MVQSVE